MQDLLAHLRNTTYPGRGIYLAHDRAVYFIMGRSQNSRNRIFVETEDGIKTEAADPAKLEDPSLIIYHPVRTIGTSLVVTNGDQTDTIVGKGDIFSASFARVFEPDDPNFTPRISAVIETDGRTTISILKRAQDGGCIRNFYSYDHIPAGEGLFISTYMGDGNPLPSYEGEPMRCGIYSAEDIWQALNEDNKVSLWAKIENSTFIYNKNLGD